VELTGRWRELLDDRLAELDHIMATLR